MQNNISNGDVWDTGFGIILSQTSNADSMSWSAINIVYVYIWASSLYRNTVISCMNHDI